VNFSEEKLQRLVILSLLLPLFVSTFPDPRLP